MVRSRRRLAGRRKWRSVSAIDLHSLLAWGADFFGVFDAAGGMWANLDVLEEAWRDPEIRRGVRELLHEKTAGVVKGFASHLFGGDGVERSSPTPDDAERALAAHRAEWKTFTVAERAKWRGKSGGKGFDSGDGGDDPEDAPSGEPAGELCEV